MTQMTRYTNPKNGDSIETSLTPEQAAELCESKGPAFAQDLAAKYARSAYLGNYFSDAQLFWMMKLAQEIFKPADKPHVVLAEDGSPTVREKVIQMFEETGLKYPKLRYVTEMGTLSVTRGRENRVHVRCGHAYQGEIIGNAFYYRHNCHDIVKKLLPVLMVDPLVAATIWGKKTGRCCFCFIELTTPESVTAGYGPICAEKWGLPWGHVSAEKTDVQTNE